MPVTGFSHYNLRADRVMLDRLRDFYANVVGMQPGFRPPFRGFGYWLYIGGQDVLHLSEARLDEVRPSHVASTFDHVALACSGYAEMMAHLDRHHVPYTLGDIPLTGQRQIFISDPAGNRVELNFAGDEV